MAAPAKGFFPTVCKIVCGGDRLYNRLRLKHQFRNSRQDFGQRVRPPGRSADRDNFNAAVGGHSNPRRWTWSRQGL